MISAIDFRTAFLEAYEQSRRTHDDGQWEVIWNDTAAWSLLMLYRKDNSHILQLTAKKLGFWCLPHEPLHLDAVFCRANVEHWFPMQVAIEQENDPNTFWQEIQKLLSVRSPLKVGITYALRDGRSPGVVRARLEEIIRREFSVANTVIGEDPTTEYLFLLGIEIENKPRELSWVSLVFHAGEGPKQIVFA